MERFEDGKQKPLPEENRHLTERMTMNRLTKVWHDPVWSAVIAGIIVLVAAPPLTYFLNWWPAIGKFAQDTYRFALSPTSLPNWFIAVICLLALPTILVLLAFLWQTVFPSQQVPDWKNYTTDTFFDLRWRWR